MIPILRIRMIWKVGMAHTSKKQIEYNRKWDCQHYDGCLSRAAVIDDKLDFCAGCMHYVPVPLFEPNLMASWELLAAIFETKK